jgi:pimeloyl-ACP methyl ester carboxylesterase
MIPEFTAAGLRCVAPDLVGFGRSDKPASRTDYTYERHVTWLRQLLFDRLDLGGITLVCQDWGGLLGLRLAGDHPERFARIVAANTMLPDGTRPLGPGFEAWRTLSQEVEEFSVSAIVDMGSRLGIQITAEGVETQSQLEALIGLGCHELQGYLLGRPVPAEDAMMLAASQLSRLRRGGVVRATR